MHQHAPHTQALAPNKRAYTRAHPCQHAAMATATLPAALLALALVALVALVGLGLGLVALVLRVYFMPQRLIGGRLLRPRVMTSVVKVAQLAQAARSCFEITRL